MTSNEWTELIEKEFHCSKRLAKEMYHVMTEYYKRKQKIKKMFHVEQSN